MELLLFILKVILIVLLAALGIILLLLVMVLFLPIRYQLAGEIQENHELELKGSLRYCFSIIKILFTYQDEAFDVSFFVLGFQKKKKQLEEEITVEEEDRADIERETTNTEYKKEPSSAQTKNTKESLEEKPLKTEKIKKQKKRISKDRFAYWKQQLTDEHNKSVLNKLIAELRYLLRHFKFRKIKTNLLFSAGDPALTGQIFGILCMIPVLYQYEFQLVPDFESDTPYIKGTFLIAGRIRLVHVLITVLRLLFDEEVRIRIKNMKAAI